MSSEFKLMYEANSQDLAKYKDLLNDFSPNFEKYKNSFNFEIRGVKTSALNRLELATPHIDTEILNFHKDAIEMRYETHKTQFDQRVESLQSVATHLELKIKSLESIKSKPGPLAPAPSIKPSQVPHNSQTLTTSLLMGTSQETAPASSTVTEMARKNWAGHMNKPTLRPEQLRPFSYSSSSESASPILDIKNLQVTGTPAVESKDIVPELPVQKPAANMPLPPTPAPSTGPNPLPIDPVEALPETAQSKPPIAEALFPLLTTSKKVSKESSTKKSKTLASQELNTLETKKVQLEEYYNLLFKEIFTRKQVGDLTEREINFQHKLLARMEEILINYDEYLAKNSFKCDLTNYLNLSHKLWTRYHVYLSELHEMGGSNLKTATK